ncbi:unnamed protein product [Closterium sp. Yama58-4]|nr:unnamed protein product [Closterium sp. Yama58-4]
MGQITVEPSAKSNSPRTSQNLLTSRRRTNFHGAIGALRRQSSLAPAVQPLRELRRVHLPRCIPGPLASRWCVRRVHCIWTSGVSLSDANRPGESVATEQGAGASAAPCRGRHSNARPFSPPHSGRSEPCIRRPRRYRRASIRHAPFLRDSLGRTIVSTFSSSSVTPDSLCHLAPSPCCITEPGPCCTAISVTGPSTFRVARNYTQNVKDVRKTTLIWGVTDS